MFNDKIYMDSKSNNTEKVKSFLDDLRDLLNKHKVKLYGEGSEVYIQNLGYIGYLEDNIQTVDIIDGNETLYSSYTCIDE